MWKRNLRAISAEIRSSEEQMNTRYNMFFIKGEIKTPDINWCRYNEYTKKMDVTFNNGKTYSYAYSNVEWLKEPEVLNPDMYRISREGREFFDITEIYVFRSAYESYWHICFGNGSERDYCQGDLNIVESCLGQGRSAYVFEYLNPSSLNVGKMRREYIPIFPFGCNNSQYKAVKNALENQISVIQGPPGTRKTQTILNIIANILMQD